MSELEVYIPRKYFWQEKDIFHRILFFTVLLSILGTLIYFFFLKSYLQTRAGQNTNLHNTVITEATPVPTPTPTPPPPSMAITGTLKSYDHSPDGKKIVITSQKKDYSFDVTDQTVINKCANLKDTNGCVLDDQALDQASTVRILAKGFHAEVIFYK